MFRPYEKHRPRNKSGTVPCVAMSSGEPGCTHRSPKRKRGSNADSSLAFRASVHTIRFGAELPENTAAHAFPIFVRRKWDRPRGLTFVELVVAMTLMALLVGMLETLAQGIHDAYEYNEGHGMATQHGRVVLDRITRAASQATANEQFPGFIVLTEQVGSWQFPDTLVVWHPSGNPVDPAGLPRYKELVIYCPAPANPNQLLEITVPNDSRVVPAVSNVNSWATEIAAIKKSQAATTVVLTDLVRACPVSASTDNARRGAVRFQTRLRPSSTEWSQYQAGTSTWTNLPWVQDQRGVQTGLRQAWLRIEVQLMPGPGILGENTALQQPIPFFGSAALYYEMHK